MFEDTWLILKFKCGSGEALGRIYEKYRYYLLKLATALLHDTGAAEDVVHDVFLHFAKSGRRIGIRGSLKSYLRISVIHGVRNHIRDNRLRGHDRLDEGEADLKSETSDCWVILNEESRQVQDALAQIPFDQREVVVLHLCGGMTFREIGQLQTESIKTIQSRYRYGLDKLRAILDSEVKNEADN